MYFFIITIATPSTIIKTITIYLVTFMIIFFLTFNIYLFIAFRKYIPWIYNIFIIIPIFFKKITINIIYPPLRKTIFKMNFLRMAIWASTINIKFITTYFITPMIRLILTKYPYFFPRTWTNRSRIYCVFFRIPIFFIKIITKFIYCPLMKTTFWV